MKSNETHEKIVAEATTLLNKLTSAVFKEEERESTRPLKAETTTSRDLDRRTTYKIEVVTAVAKEKQLTTTSKEKSEFVTEKVKEVANTTNREEDKDVKQELDEFVTTSKIDVSTQGEKIVATVNIKDEVSRTEKIVTTTEIEEKEFARKTTGKIITQIQEGENATERGRVMTTTEIEENEEKIITQIQDRENATQRGRVMTTTEIEEETEKIITQIQDRENATQRGRVVTTTEIEENELSTKTEKIITQIQDRENTTQRGTVMTTTEIEEKTEKIITQDRENATQRGRVMVITETEETESTSIEDRESVTKRGEIMTTTEEEGEVFTRTAERESTVEARIVEEPTKSSTRSVNILTTEKLLSSTTDVSLMESDGFTESIALRMVSPLTKKSNPVCESAICKTAASRILSTMNHSATPCEDFYEFACGRVYQTDEDSTEANDAKVLAQLDVVNNSSAKYERDFKRFYQSCVQHENYFNYRKRMDRVEEFLQEVGQFQLDNTSLSVPLTDLVGDLLLRQSMPLFDVGLDVDKQSSNLILQLTLPHKSFLRTGVDNWSGLSLLKSRCLRKQKSQTRGSHISLAQIYESFQSCQHDYSGYLDSIEAVIRELRAFSTLSPDSLLATTKNIRFSIEYDVLNNLDALPPSVEILTNFINKNYDMRKISDLQLHYPIFDWKSLFERLTGREVAESTMVQVYFGKYFHSMFTSLAKTTKSVLHNAFLSIHAYDLFINTVIPKHKSNREQFCTDLSKKLLPDVWSSFVQSTVTAQDQQEQNKRATDLFDSLKKNFCHSLLEAEWIDDNTKTSVVKKCNRLDLIFFTPLEESVLLKNYEELNLTEDYQTNLIKIMSNFKRNIYSTQGTQISGDKIFSYFLDPLGSEPMTFYTKPSIAVPLGLMERAPTGLPKYLILTRAGLALARQMARHFDPTGMTFGIKLASTSKSTYAALVETMTTMMDSTPRILQGKNISFSLNGTLSINERIVDNTAFRLIFDSFGVSEDKDILPWISAQYSREKVFFIATAQELCKKTTILEFMLQVFEKPGLPAALRVENMMRNSEDFSKKFSCAEGAGMNLFPEKLQFPYLTPIEDEYEYNG
ncbi:hypothetical protein MTP99_010091 [Tenebrio molitor]|nr:hypothetical protein MTP99_010091 [Tenebrio molitor]